MGQYILTYYNLVFYDIYNNLEVILIITLYSYLDSRFEYLLIFQHNMEKISSHKYL